MTRTLTIEVENRAGELARIVNAFAARGVNIRSLAVTPVGDGSVSTIAICLDADDRTTNQLLKLIDRQVRVISVREIPTNTKKETTTMEALYDSGIDRSALAGRTIAVIGYGSQGHAHADNLRDSGCRVIVGLRPDSAARGRAQSAGHDVRTTAEATAASDVVMMLVPDELAPRTYREEVAPHLRTGSYLAFAHGFAVHFKKIVPPDDVNVFMVAPKGPGHLVRREFSRGRGVPCLVAVHSDPSGDTRAVALAYAAAIGAGRAGILETTFREETETDLFGEQAVLCGGLTALIQSGFETLVDAGYAPEMAYFECMHEMKLIVDLLYEGGLAKMRHSISNTAEYGDLTRGERVINASTRVAMQQILADIQSGKFADEWMAECDSGKPQFTRLEAEGLRHPIETVGTRLRSMMPWLQSDAEEGSRRAPGAGPHPAFAQPRPAGDVTSPRHVATREEAREKAVQGG